MIFVYTASYNTPKKVERGKDIKLKDIEWQFQSIIDCFRPRFTYNTPDPIVSFWGCGAIGSAVVLTDRGSIPLSSTNHLEDGIAHRAERTA